MPSARTLLFALFALAGCSHKPAEGTVTGTVTIDGTPVDGGLIRFVPTDGNSSPDDCKVAAGAYVVTMPVGEKRVEVFWMKTSGPAEDTATQGSSKSVQMIPPQFNTQSTLTYTIVKGPQTKNFELQSK